MHKIYGIFYLLLWSQFSFAQVNNIGIGTTNPDPSAVLELQSTNQGFLIPRMNQAGEDALPNPAQGLMIFNTDIYNGIGLSAPRFYNGSFWNTVIGEKSNGEIFLDNGGFNWFNTSAGAAIDFNINSGMVLRLESNQNVLISKPGTDENIHFVNGHHITTRGDDWLTYKDLYLNYDGGAVRLGPGHLTLGPWGSFRAVFYEDSNVQFTHHGLGNSLIFENGDHIQARSPDWQQARTLYLNHNEGEIRMGPGTVTFGGWNNERVFFHPNGDVRFHKLNSDQNLFFLNGNSIAARGNNGTTPHDLRFQSNGGDIHFGSGTHNFPYLKLKGDQGFSLSQTFVSSDFTCSNNFIIEGSGRISIGDLPQLIGGNTTSLVWTSDNRLVREASSRRYKKDIRDAEIDFRKILELEVKEYYYRKDTLSEHLQLGVIAEEADELGLSYLVARDKEGEIRGFHYRKMGLYLLPIVQEHEQMLNDGDEKINDLQAEIAAMKKWKQEVETLLSKRD